MCQSQPNKVLTKYGNTIKLGFDSIIFPPQSKEVEILEALNMQGGFCSIKELIRNTSKDISALNTLVHYRKVFKINSREFYDQNIDLLYRKNSKKVCKDVLRYLKQEKTLIISLDIFRTKYLSIEDSETQVNNFILNQINRTNDTIN